MQRGAGGATTTAAGTGTRTIGLPRAAAMAPTLALVALPSVAVLPLALTAATAMTPTTAAVLGLAAALEVSFATPTTTTVILSGTVVIRAIAGRAGAAALIGRGIVFTRSARVRRK